ncbi:hypothetical protein QNA24_26395 [Rhodococcus qingshengii]|uniref:hypothetical protein n=1 Tax=Rhodococcus qingshengii TaxID=334542 RepID=UPI0005A7369E|nr:hypothetical protein [Rhodococcus qingshengii]MDJ0489916.1 hypothetical protein [Rhodococcus qingshengii]
MTNQREGSRRLEVSDTEAEPGAPYSAPDGDIASALTTTCPVRVPLPSQPQGEAIAFTPEGDPISGSEAIGGALPSLLILRGATGLAHSGVATGSLDQLPAAFGS